ncbi:MAG TPA: hypothetical protein VNJ03_05985 [Vicinamibacterales bacterium]|nr:hypothetical protein [Vicinamibacterales bacterium]
MTRTLILAVMTTFALGQDARTPEATSLLGTPLFAPAQSEETRAKNEANLAAAKAALAKNPGSADAAIWVGRRTAYLGRFRDAIAVYTDAMSRHPSDARLYRHRGHRYISVREFDKAIADLSKAAALVAGRADDGEPDGQPNARNTPTGTLKTNIYYHLGLAHYLKGEFALAADAYRLCMEHSKNADMQVATAHWQYMAARRAGRPGDAKQVLEPITATMDVFENGSYHKLLMMYKNERQADTLAASLKAGSLDAATIGYGIANWHMYNDRRGRSEHMLRAIVDENPTQWASFGYIAAEADLARMRRD